MKAAKSNPVPTRNKVVKLSPLDCKPNLGEPISIFETYDGVISRQAAYFSAPQKDNETINYDASSKRGKKKHRFPYEVFSSGIVSNRRCSAGQYKIPLEVGPSIKYKASHSRQKSCVTGLGCINPKQCFEVNPKHIQKCTSEERLVYPSTALENNNYASFLPEIKKTGKDTASSTQVRSARDSKNKREIIEPSMQSLEQHLQVETPDETPIQVHSSRDINNSPLVNTRNCLSGNQCANLDLISSSWANGKSSITFNINQNFYFNSSSSPRKITIAPALNKKVKTCPIKIPKALLKPTSTVTEGEENPELRKTAYFKNNTQGNPVQNVHPIPNNKKFNFLNRMQESLKLNKKSHSQKHFQTIKGINNTNIKKSNATGEDSNQCDITFGNQETEEIPNQYIII